VARLEPEYPAVPRRNAYAPADVSADAERGAIRREQCAFAAGRAARGVRGRPWAERAAPERVRTLKGEQRLRHVRLGDDDGARCAQLRDDLLAAGEAIGGEVGDVKERRGKEEEKNGKRTAASRSAGLFAHCVYPIVLSNPFTSTENRPRTFLILSTAPARPKGRKKGEKGVLGREARRGRTRTHVLDSNRHAVQRPLQAAALRILIQLESFLPGLFEEH